jgi:hypothetical protein
VRATVIDPSEGADIAPFQDVAVGEKLSVAIPAHAEKCRRFAAVLFHPLDEVRPLLGVGGAAFQS